MARAHVQGQGRPWTSPFLSKSLLGWLSYFLSCWSHPWKGFEVWSVFDVFFWPCQSLPRRQQALSSLCKWVFKSVCLPSCCVSLLSLWCPSSIVPCMPHSVPGMVASPHYHCLGMETYIKMISGTPPYPSQCYFLLPIPSPSLSLLPWQTDICQMWRNFNKWNKAKQTSKTKKR